MRTSLPHLSKQLGDQNNGEKQKKIKKNERRKNDKSKKIKIAVSRRAQLPIYAVFDEESESEVKNHQIFQLELKK